MTSLLRSRATLIWLILVLATTLSWTLGTESGSGNQTHRVIGVIILAVAIFKIRLVGLYFMELRDAPRALRTIFEIYCLAVAGATIGIFLIA